MPNIFIFATVAILYRHNDKPLEEVIPADFPGYCDDRRIPQATSLLNGNGQFLLTGVIETAIIADRVFGLPSVVHTGHK